MNFRWMAEKLGLALTAEQEQACAKLEAAGLKFGVHFGHGNCIAKAAALKNDATMAQAMTTKAIPVPTKTVWVSKEASGEWRAVRVVDMETMHLQRWIAYFRKKYRTSGASGTDAEIDALIQKSMVTAPAIYAEAKKRGVYFETPTATAGQAVLPQSRGLVMIPCMRPGCAANMVRDALRMSWRCRHGHRITDRELAERARSLRADEAEGRTERAETKAQATPGVTRHITLEE